MNKQSLADARTDERLRTAKMMLDSKLLHEEQEYRGKVQAIWGEYEQESKLIVNTIATREE